MINLLDFNLFIVSCFASIVVLENKHFKTSYNYTCKSKLLHNRLYSKLTSFTNLLYFFLKIGQVGDFGVHVQNHVKQGNELGIENVSVLVTALVYHVNHGHALMGSVQVSNQNKSVK